MRRLIGVLVIFSCFFIVSVCSASERGFGFLWCSCFGGVSRLVCIGFWCGLLVVFLLLFFGVELVMVKRL